MRTIEEEPLQLFMVQGPGNKLNPAEWIVDSGASASMSCRREWFKTFCALVPTKHIIIGDGWSIEATGIGSIELEVEVGVGQTRRTVLQDTYYVPNLDGNLLSISCLASRGYEATFGQHTCTITRNGSIAALARRQESLYILKGQTCTTERAYIIEGPRPNSLLNAEEPIVALTACTYTLKATIETWHRQLAHIMPDSVKKLFEKDMVKGMEVDRPLTHDDATCEVCLKGKQLCKPIPTESNVENPRVLHRTYSDIWGPMDTEAHGSY